MELVQTMDAGVEAIPVPWSALDWSMRKPGHIVRAFLVAIGLHIVGLGLLVFAFQHWPMVRSRPVTPLELDLAVEARSIPVPAEPSVWEQAAAAMTSERMPVGLVEACVPEAGVVSIPEPALAFSPDSAACDVPVLIPERRGEWSGPVTVSSATARGNQGVTRFGAHPTALSEIQPRYPYGARTRGEEGRVTVKVKVSQEGDVDDAVVSVSSGYPSLDESALVATRKARFRAAEKEGHPVAAEMELQFQFRLQD